MKRPLVVSLLLFAAAFLSYRKAMRLYWTYDTPYQLLVAIGRRWIDDFVNADTQQNLFVPLLAATNEVLLAVFGLEPSRWYLAQVVLIAITALSLYAALRLYVSTHAAVAGALLFLLGPPIASAASTLYVIHYLEAILFGTLATSLFVLAVRRDSMALSIASAVLYLAAMCAKEIAVLLPLFLFVLPDGTLRTRVRHLVPHGTALTVYACWRLLVIGTPTSGYGWALTGESIVTLPWRLLAAAAGASLPLGLAVIVLALVCAALVMRTRRAVAVALVGLACAVAPIVPVSVEMQDRFALLPWVWLSCAFAIGAARVKWPALAVIVLAIVANRQEWTAEYTRAKRMSDEAHVWVHERGDVLLRNPAIPPGTMPPLAWLKEEHFGHAKGARWFYDDIYLCTHPIEGRRILEYDVQSRRIEEVQVRCNPSRTDVPMSADFVYDDGTLLWRFGPYDDGTWRLILLDGEHAWDVPGQSAYRLGTTKQLALRIGYRSPAGWVTYSPTIALDFTRQSRTTWRR